MIGVKTDENDIITDVSIGGSNSWYMLGHTFWSEEFSQNFLKYLEAEYNNPETASLLWESIYVNHIDALKMKIRRYDPNVIFEFDTMDELYKFNTGAIE